MRYSFFLFVFEMALENTTAQTKHGVIRLRVKMSCFGFFQKRKYLKMIFSALLKRDF